MAPVRFVYDREMPEDLLHVIIDGLKLKNFENIVPGGRYHNRRDYMSFPNLGRFDFNSNNAAQFDLDSGRAKWATLRLVQNSIYPCKYYKFGALLQSVGRR
ncbi:MAG: hypothetical protein HGA25_00270 [Clostridiales bacterium]|nr:hypothetical protein [Clostridiales bacterium]